MTERSFLDEVHALATGAVPISDINDPWPSAKLIGEMCCVIVEISKERGYIPKGQVQKFEEQGRQLKEKGSRHTWEFNGADFALTSGPRMFEHVGSPLDEKTQAAFDFCRSVTRRAYEPKRVEMAKAFVQLEAELLTSASRTRGRPKGKGRHDDMDGKAIINAAVAALEAKGSDARLQDVEDSLKDVIAGMNYPSLGDKSDLEHTRSHKQRIKRKIPKVISDVVEILTDRKRIKTQK